MNLYGLFTKPTIPLDIGRFTILHSGTMSVQYTQLIHTCMLTHTHTYAGDRIAIISSGSLICCGSFEFLRRRFGQGHRLTLVTSSRSHRRASTSSHTHTVTMQSEDTDHAHPAPSRTYQPEASALEDRTKRITSFVQVRRIEFRAVLKQ